MPLPADRLVIQALEAGVAALVWFVVGLKMGWSIVPSRRQAAPSEDELPQLVPAPLASASIVASDQP